ncbi:MAG TPA: hypothetical protein VHX11_11940 [Acidobacteriaceae bacterium]|nr:hypothetical protein [Acidobacteriaceae bacterium]
MNSHSPCYGSEEEAETVGLCVNTPGSKPTLLPFDGSAAIGSR